MLCKSLTLFFTLKSLILAIFPFTLNFWIRTWSQKSSISKVQKKCFTLVVFLHLQRRGTPHRRPLRSPLFPPCRVVCPLHPFGSHHDHALHAPNNHTSAMSPPKKFTNIVPLPLWPSRNLKYASMRRSPCKFHTLAPTIDSSWRNTLKCQGDKIS